MTGAADGWFGPVGAALSIGNESHVIAAPARGMAVESYEPLLLDPSDLSLKPTLAIILTLDPAS